MSHRILWALFALVITSGIVLPANSLAAETIRGRVVGRQSDGAVVPLRGATVKWKNTTIGTIVKSADGMFTIDRVASTDTLEVRFVSYITAFVVIERGRDTIEVSLMPSASQEVVVEAEESAVTRAPVKTEVITKKDLAKAACCSLAESLKRTRPLKCHSPTR